MVRARCSTTTSRTETITVAVRDDVFSGGRRDGVRGAGALLATLLLWACAVDTGSSFVSRAPPSPPRRYDDVGGWSPRNRHRSIPSARDVAFVPFPDERQRPQQRQRQRHQQRTRRRRPRRTTATCLASSHSDDDEDEDVDALLEQVSLEKLEDLCGRFSLSTETTATTDEEDAKRELVGRLRAHAAEQLEIEKRRRVGRVERARKDGVDVSEVDVEYLEDDARFYYAAPETPKNDDDDENKSARSTNDDKNNEEKENNGVKVVTVYDSRDTNDLTGFHPGSTPGQAWSNSATTLGTVEGSGSTSTSKFFGDNQKKKKAGSYHQEPHHNDDSQLTEAEFEAAKEQCTNLLKTILVRTGLPAFVQMMDDDDDDDAIAAATSSSSSPATSYAPFDPSFVPQSLLERYRPHLMVTSALRAAGEALEIHAVGHDGMAADDVEEGGGHYSEVRKAMAFLSGYATAQHRAEARDTASRLLDALVTGGVRELDRALATGVQTRRINDRLVDYLNDLVREQEAKADRDAATATASSNGSTDVANDDKDRLRASEDELSEVGEAIVKWNVTKRDADGAIAEESIDPNDPAVKEALRKEAAAAAAAASSFDPREQVRRLRQQPASTQVLTMLRLLRERVKAEAAFFKKVREGGPAAASSSSETEVGERGRHLRLLAYCLHASSSEERDRLLLSPEEGLGSSLDRLDAFAEMVDDALLYAESPTRRLAPGGGNGGGRSTATATTTTTPLDASRLRVVSEHVRALRESQRRRAAGGAAASPRTLLENDDVADDDDGLATSWE